MIKEKNFDKYKKRGDYHWKSLDKNIFRFNAFLSQRYENIIKFCHGSQKTHKILDIGCGDGALDYLIHKKYHSQIFGIDPLRDAIKITESKFRKLQINNCRFKVGGAYDLEFKNNFFDVVILADVIEHIQYPQKALKESFRVLKPKGKIIVSSVIKTSNVPEDKLHVREYTVVELEGLLNKYFVNLSTLKSHTLLAKKVYQWHFSVARFKPQPFRYIINFLNIVFGINLFVFGLGNKFSCQTIVGIKK